MPSVVAAIYHEIASPGSRLPDWALSDRVWLGLIMLILAPLSFLRRLDSLRHASFIALLAIGKRIGPEVWDDRADRYLN
jgi:amino acid permease